jgi:predicted thioesterase
MALFIERACMALIQPHLPGGRTSVGVELRLRHLAPTPLGGTVWIRAELVGVDGERLRFEARLWDDEGPVGECEHTRHVVDTERFLARVRAKADRLRLPGSG